MRLTKTKTTFGRHETFPLRYGWLTKGVEALSKQSSLFQEHESEMAMTRLGIGRNMVNALHYWLQVVGLVQFQEGKGQITPLGQTIFQPKGDFYLEDEVTLWVLHWLIASQAELATGFFWFFNYFAPPRFRDKEALQALENFVAQDLGLRRSLATLKSDVSTLLRMYAPLAQRGGEEHLDSPLASLQLVTVEEGYGYHSARTWRPFLPPLAMHIALQQRFASEPSESAIPAIPIRELLYGGSGWAAPGAVFRLNEEGLMHSLNQVMEDYPQCYALRDTAGINQLYCLTKPQAPDVLLADYYQKVVLA